MARTRMQKVVGNTLIDENDDHEENQLHADRDDSTDDETDGENLVKKTRGPTYMKEVWGQPRNFKRYKIRFNKEGEPVSKNKSKFVDFLGTIARNGLYAPINVEDWHKITEDQRKDMIAVVKEKFKLPPGSEAWTLRSIGKKWRNWKSALKAKYYDPDATIESQIHNRDVRVLEDQWRNILAYWKSEKATDVSQMNKERRAKRTMNHKTGKKSYAQLRKQLKKKLGRSPTRVEMFEQCYTDSNGIPPTNEVATTLSFMKEKVNQLPPGVEDSVSQNDCFAQVVGQDRNGRVRMYGLGVAPSDLWGNVPSRSTCHRIVMQQKATLAKMEEKFAKQDEQLKEQAIEIENLKIRVQQQNNNGSTSESGINSRSSNHISTSATISRALADGDWVALFSILDQSKKVAIGRLQSIDASTIVGGHQLGFGWFEIVVQIVIEREEQLIRPYEPMSTIGDAIGAPIAWPSNLVKIQED